jgi:hypothetical protein
MTPSAEAIRAAIMNLATERGPERSFCPSEPARLLSGDWRALMPAVRAEAARLQRDGVIAASQRGQAVVVEEARGPIRLRLAGRPSNS